MTSRMQDLISTPIFQAQLREPWEAKWLAGQWPEVFSLQSDARGIVEVHDVWEGMKLTGNVELDTDEAGLILWVHGVPHEMIVA